jgi:plastocyanin
VRPHLPLVAAALVLTSACASDSAEQPRAELQASPTTPPATATAAPSPQSTLVDPRKNGFEVGFGEFAVTLEAEAIRPGPVRFVVRNGGELVHGFEMEIESEEGDSSGPGGGDEDRFKVERPTFGSGESIAVDVDLAPGFYKVYCYVADHEERGMVAFFEVRRGAPKVEQEVRGGNAVAVEGFAFVPSTLEVLSGTEVTWTNRDPTTHTVTAEDGSFDSGPLDQGGTFAMTFNEPGTVAYFCSIHPTMKGTVTVQA